MSDEKSDEKEQIKTFAFTSRPTINRECLSSLKVYIPELLQASYSFYTWPSASVLAWFLWEQRGELRGKRILELGCGTALPGILAAKCGAKVILSDSAILSKTLSHIHRCCEVNGLAVGRDIEIIGLTWGLFLNNIFHLGGLDLLLGSDVFYDPTFFEDILITISFLLELNPGAKFVCAYQERSADWSIEHLLQKWSLKCHIHDISNLGADGGLDLHDITGDHTIHLLSIYRD